MFPQKQASKKVNMHKMGFIVQVSMDILPGKYA